MATTDDPLDRRSAARRVLASIDPLRRTYHRARSGLFAHLSRTNPLLLAKVRFREAWGRWPNLVHPTTFDEKLLWLNLYWRDPVKVECGDKYTMRLFAEKRGYAGLLPELYGVYSTTAGIDFRVLPDRFVLKCSHGCKCNVFCHDRRSFDEAEAKRKLDVWLATDYSTLLGELHYAAMSPRILCEEYLEDGTGRLPIDYKLYCFNGEPAWILGCYDRQPNEKARLFSVDMQWRPVQFYRGDTAAPPVGVPAALNHMIESSRALAKGIPFVRMDFYSVKGRAILGEMTFTPDACLDPSYTDQMQQEMGDRLVLPTTVGS